MEENTCGEARPDDGRSNSNSRYGFRVVIFYDEAEAARRAMNKLRNVTDTWDDFNSQVRLWRLDALMDTTRSRIVAEQLARADLLMLVLNDAGSLDENIRQRLRQALHKMRGRSAAAVAVLKEDNTATTPACFDFLQQGAREAGVEFIFPSSETQGAFAAIQRQATAPQSEETAQLQQRVRILCVDDDASIRKICQMVLTKLGYDVDTAANGAEGWAAVKSHKYHLLITDNDMPHLTGVGLIHKMRLTGMTVPFILTSGALGGISTEELSRLGCGAILAKPFTPQQLLSAVHEILLPTLSA